MMTAMRRLFLLSAAAGGSYAAWSWYQGRQQLPMGDAPEWPPLEPPAPASAPETASAAQGFAAMPAGEPTASAPTASEPAATEPAAAAAAPVRTPAPAPTDGPRTWVDPIDGECPDGYPIKANDNSGIYHVPGGRFYGRTRAERCYASADDAEADGYRAAKA